MRYKSEKTAKGNVGVSWVSAEMAVEQAEEMDNNDCTDCMDCTGCMDCTDCMDCTGCTGCMRCMGCTGCTGCTDCMGCTGCMRCMDCTGCTGCTGCTRCMRCTGCTRCTLFVKNKISVTPEQAIENLDKVRAIILDDAARLEMGHWHGTRDWRNKTCAEEVVCGTTHCLAGWLQVCSTDPEIRSADTQIAGAMQAPIAGKMFFCEPDEVLAWLTDRAYVKELGVIETPEAP